MDNSINNASKHYKRLRVYIAGPLFSKAELDFNIMLKKLLNPFFDIYLPQEDGGLISEMVQNGMDLKIAVNRVFLEDISAIKRCDLLLIVLDGRSIDEGAAFELGFAYAYGKICFGIQTDTRRLFGDQNNPMIDCPIIYTFKNVEDLVDWASNLILENPSLTDVADSLLSKANQQNQIDIGINSDIFH